MTPQELKEERDQLRQEVEALKKLFGGLLLEDCAGREADVAYFQRKYNEARERLKRVS